MGKIHNNLISTTAGFNYSAPQPLDDREVVQSYSDLAELVNSNIAYKGMRVYVIDNKKSYELTDGSWVALATEDYTKDYIDTIIDSGRLDNGVQPDWNQTDESQLDYIKNKPKQTNKTLVFDTKNDLDDWISGSFVHSSGVQKSDLTVGDTFVIKETGYPDYHWDGSQIIESGSAVGRQTAAGGEIFNDYENNEAQAKFSHASGTGTIATIEAQMVAGKYNAQDNEALFIVGNGTSNTDRKNALVVKTDGSVIANNKELATSEEVNSIRTQTEELSQKVVLLSSSKTKRVVVTTLPNPEDADQSVIYMIKQSDDIYKEYVVFTNSETDNLDWLLIGTIDTTFDLDLSNYYTKEEVSDMIANTSHIQIVTWEAGD